MSGKWLIVSNRLPFKLDADGNLSPSSGGLVTAIRGIEFREPAMWLGAAPEGLSREAFDAGVEAVRDEGDALRYAPVFVDPELYESYYNGICNDVLWPLLHYEAQELSFDPDDWRAYRKVNEIFAHKVLEQAEDGDVIWVHDYHLFLLPRLLRELAPDRDLRIGFFLHVPFPSDEIFRQLPVRVELLESLLAADLVGFHDYDYLRHFGSAVQRLLGINSNMLTVPDPGGERATQLGVFPVSIHTERFHEDAFSPEADAHYKSFAEQQHCETLILGVDRLDYMKGISLKLKAFERYLEAHPEDADRVRLLQITVPSRTSVPEYARLRETIERMVGEINGRFGSPNFMPVHYMFSSVTYEELLALYRLADVLLVTSKRDGMNLVAQEYIACQPEHDPGVLVLSEFAGSSSVLSQALRINPWDLEDTAAQLGRALRTTRAERIAWHAPMMQYLQGYDASAWANSFVRSLAANTSATPTNGQARNLPSHLDEIVDALTEKSKLLVLLDYDGTLVPIEPTPEAATLDAEMFDTLAAIIDQPQFELYVVSGRDEAFLRSQFQDLELDFGSEHGAFFCTHDGATQ